MQGKQSYRLRNLAAILITFSGIGHIAALWLRELTELAVLDALLGTVYLIIGIGLFGQSRFALFMAIVTPGAISGFLLANVTEPGQIMTVRITIDVIVVCCSLIVLWQVRNNPSV